MKCCVGSCKNNAKQCTKSGDISFVTLPCDPVARTQWLWALGKTGVKGKASVCTDHFHKTDLCLGLNGEVSVRAGAAPKAFEVCRICLCTDWNGKFYDLREGRHAQAYETMTAITVSTLRGPPPRVCAVCAWRLSRHTRFRHAALASHRLLGDILASCDQTTPDHIEHIVRLENKLLPRLSYKHYEPQYYDGSNQEIDVPIPLLNDVTDTIPLHEVNINIESKIDENDTQDSIKSEADSLDNRDENPIPDVREDAFSSDDDRPIVQPKVQSKKVEKTLTKKAKNQGVTAKKTKSTLSNKEPRTDRRKKVLGDDLDAAIFTSSHLSAEEQIAEFQKRMQSANYKNSVFKCGACYKGFLDEDAYNNHMVRHTDQCGAHECSICKIRFKQPHALRNHVTSHMQKFTCKCCPYVTYRKQTAKLHEEWHNGTRYQCPHCQEEFLKFTTYMGHIRIKHPSDCVCRLCGYSFVSEKGLRLHTKLKHRLDEDEVVPADAPGCERCGVRFLTADALRRHLLVSARHRETDGEAKQPTSQRKPRKQKEGKNGSPQADGDERKRKRSVAAKPEGPIPCEQCNMQLEDSRAYYKHFRRAHPDKNRTNYPSMKSPCMCERCGRMFQTLALLLDHAHVHSGEQRFRCTLCGKRFQQRQRLVAHRHVHSAQRAAYACADCGKRFSTHSNRQRHAFSHTGLKPFKCEMCGKCFKHASEKRAHVAYVHLKKPWPKRARHKRPRDACEATELSREPPQREMAIIEPLWTACAEPKMDATSLSDKTLYYNMKI